jgi:hypothetical protein
MCQVKVSLSVAPNPISPAQCQIWYERYVIPIKFERSRKFSTSIGDCSRVPMPYGQAGWNRPVAFRIKQRGESLFTTSVCRLLVPYSDPNATGMLRDFSRNDPD